MKKCALLLLLIFGTLEIHAQIEMHFVGVDPGPVYYIDSTSTETPQLRAEWYLVNYYGTSQDVTINRIRYEHTVGWTEGLSTFTSFAVADIDDWTTPASTTIAAGDSILMTADIFTDSLLGCGIYTYTVYNDSANVMEDSAEVHYIDVIGPCGGAGLGQSDKKPISLYPNPSSKGLLTVVYPEMLGYYELYTLDGQKIKAGKLFNGNNEVDLSGESKGSYIIRVFDEHRSILMSTQVVRE